MMTIEDVLVSIKQHAAYATNYFQLAFPTRRSSDLSIFSEPDKGTLVRRWWDIKEPGFFGKKLGTVMMNIDRKSTRLNSSHMANSYTVFLLKKKKTSPIHRDSKLLMSKEDV